MLHYINTDEAAARYRDKILNLREQKILLTNFHGTEQESDLSEPANCRGFGRVRHFKRCRLEDWVENPLPIDPAVRSLGLVASDTIRAQVFQTAACNWRCWYCFVPFNLLSANRNQSSFLSVPELLDLMSQDNAMCPVIDLSGGEPGLTPEWMLWWVEELERREMTRRFYLWSDDNLSVDYFWRVLSSSQQEKIISYAHSGRVGCFKGFDEDSFSYNTSAAPELFKRQFAIMKRLISTGMDVYAYVTLTTPSVSNIRGQMRRFVDRLQSISETLPLRTVPLRIEVFSPVAPRLRASDEAALRNQEIAVESWLEEIDSRFTSGIRDLSVTEVAL